MKTQIIEIKTGSTPINQIVEAVQGDSGRVLRCIISDMSIPVGSTARFYAKKPSGAEVYNDCQISDNSAIVKLTTQVLAEVGIVRCQVEVTNNEKTVTAFLFCIDVKNKIKSDNAIESKNEFTALEEALRKAEEVADPLINFEEAAEREMLTTGERLSVLVGKISKWIKDLKKAAFYDVANNATTATAGTSVLDAYQGKLLKEQLDEQNTKMVPVYISGLKKGTKFQNGSIIGHKLGRLVVVHIESEPSETVTNGDIVISGLPVPLVDSCPIGLLCVSGTYSAIIDTSGNLKIWYPSFATVSRVESSFCYISSE